VDRFDLSGLLREAGLKPTHPYNVLPAMLVPALDKAAWKVARQIATLRLAAVACALERHRLRHGGYPATLAELAPAFIPAVPADPMTGKPFGYERPESGPYRLWSAGLNGRDDGGVMLDKRNDEDGDWVWPNGELRPSQMRLF
jgi:hypothetical protein